MVSVLSLALIIPLQLTNGGGYKLGLALTIWQGGRAGLGRCHQGQYW